MSYARPLPKEVLKRMFLKLLYEIRRPRGPLNGIGSATDSIIRHTLPMFFDVHPPLSVGEVESARQAVCELERDGFIEPDPDQSSEQFKVLSERGKGMVDQLGGARKIATIDIDALLSHDELRNEVRDDYLEGDWEAAVSKAFKMVEASVRNKTGQPSGAAGIGLMTAAFRSGGILQHPDAQTSNEEEALHKLFRGAIGWFQNPMSHRTVWNTDEHSVAHTLCFVNVLLDLANQCRVVPKELERVAPDLVDEKIGR